MVKGFDRERVVELLKQRQSLTDFLFQYKDDLKRVHDARRIGSSAWAVELSDLLTLTAYAPYAWVPSRPLHEFGGHPPAPQFEQMRAGKIEALHQSSKDIIERLSFNQSNRAVSLSKSSDVVRERQGIELYVDNKGRVLDEWHEEDEVDDDDEEGNEEGGEDDEHPRKRQALLPAELGRSAAGNQEAPELLSVPEPTVQVLAGSSRRIEMSFGGDSSDDES